ncbi:MAG: hypothetical protein IMZ52_05225 [Actinobacteria bacterium]|nr:hypothetical protein [Actinomycetota bacterium]
MPDLEVSYAVYFNSGMNSRSNSFINGSNITHIQLNNSDQSYYQDGIIELYDCSAQVVGDSVDIYINDSYEFSGYVSRRQIHHKAGKHLYSYQLIGKTYDLWRFRTGRNDLYTGYSGYIASSLVSKYCYPTVLGNSNITDGCSFTNPIDLSDQTVGDALVTLIGYDAFKFYVDTDRKLVYYDPSEEATSIIMVEEDDILDMTPIEEADEDLVNDVLVIGGTAYSNTTNIPLPIGKPIVQVSSAIFKRNMYIAQRFKPKDETLSAIRMFLDRTVEPNVPDDSVHCEIWDNTTQEIINDSFDDGMKNWSVTSNTYFDNGYLKLIPLGDMEEFKQLTNSASILYFYHGQTFTPTVTAVVNSAMLASYHYYGVDKTLWIEIRSTTGSPAVPTATIHCSGSIILPDSVFYDTPIPMKPRYILNAGTTYAIVAHLQNPSTTNKIYGKYWSADICGGNRVLSSTGGSSWASDTTSDMRFWVKLGDFATSGYALSKPFGSPTRKIYDKYMKVDLDGLTSSNRIYISGSNSGSKHYHTLTNDQWYNFGFENKFSSQVKIWLSGNGTYTPKVDSIVVSIADTTGGPDATLFTDTFDDYTYLSGATRNKILVDNGLLIMSGSKGVIESTKWKRPTSIIDTLGIWNYETYIIDNLESTCGTYEFTPTPYLLALVTTFDNYTDISRIKFKAINDWYMSRNITVTNIWISGNSPGIGFVKVWEGSTKITGYHVLLTTEIPFTVSYNVKKVAISGTCYTDLGGSLRIFDMSFLQENITTYSGSIQSKDYNVGIPVIYLNISPTNDSEYNPYITYSGSKDSGSTWYKLTKDTWTLLGAGGASGQHIKIMYNMKPYNNYSPSIESAILMYSTIQGGNLPKSGTKIEHSDDISFTESLLAYPPSYTAYQSYDSPKLKDDNGLDFNENNYYWLVMYCYTGATAATALDYFKYYYDPASTYTDGAIAYSTGQTAGGTGVGITWKNYQLKPTWVPNGSIIMDMGWKEDEIRATATNEQSISLYGRHQKILNDSTITSYDQALAVAEAAVEGMEDLKRKGSITLDGIVGIKTNYKISSSLTNLGIGGLWEIVSYSQILDNKGFRTIVNYGVQEFDITKEINDLKKAIGI